MRVRARIGNALAVLGALGLLGLAVGAAAMWRWTGSGLDARHPPASLEEALAQRIRSWSSRSPARPAPTTQEQLTDARAHWADHCALCHGNDGRGSDLGRRMRPRAPDMTSTSTQSKPDGRLYAAIQDGIRLSGMPFWGDPRDDDPSTWALVAFIRHLPQLSPDDLRGMTRVNPRSPSEVGETEEDDAFLKGGAPPHHHGVH